jgi:hypothetical protein
MEDSPTNNFATMNSLADKVASLGGSHTTVNSGVLSEGNLKQTAASGYTGFPATFAVSSGKWYLESLWESSGSGGSYAVVFDANDPYEYNDGPDTGWFTGVYGIIYSGYSGEIMNNNSVTQSSLSTMSDGDIVGIAIDLDSATKTVQYYLNNSTVGSAETLNTAASGTWSVSLAAHNVWDITSNFGQDSSFAGALTAQGNQDDNEVGDFYHDVPAGYLALCTSNLAAPEIADPTLAVTGVGFAPDFTWIKNRDAADNHTLVDEVRGATKYLVSNDTAAEVDDSTFVASLDSDGFTVGDDVAVNTNTENYVSWNWKGDGVAGGTLNQDGSIDSQVNVNTTAGFSIVSYTGTGSAVTVGHGLSQAPELIITKKRSNTASNKNWFVAATPIGTGNTVLELNTGDGATATPSPAAYDDPHSNSSVVDIETNANMVLSLHFLYIEA